MRKSRYGSMLGRNPKSISPLRSTVGNGFLMALASAAARFRPKAKQ